MISMFSSAKRGFLLWAMLLGLTPMVSPAQELSPDERRTIRDELKRRWESLESLACRCEGFPADRSGMPISGQGSIRYRFVIGSGNRRMVEGINCLPDGSRDLISRLWEDGRREYEVIAFPGHPDSMDQFLISNQRSGPERFARGISPPPRFFLLPGGKPLHEEIDAGAALNWIDEAGGAMEVRFQAHGRDVRCELDPDHDWLPRRIQLRSVEFVVAEFGRDNGRWFPVRVEATQRSGETVCLVSDLKINRELPASTFDPPDPIPGAIVIDQTRSAAARIVGGDEARNAAIARYRPSKTTHESAQGPIVASRDPESYPWQLGIAVVAILMLACATYLWRRGQ